jgi:hypothetical protein
MQPHALEHGDDRRARTAGNNSPTLAWTSLAAVTTGGYCEEARRDWAVDVCVGMAIISDWTARVRRSFGADANLVISHGTAKDLPMSVSR